MRMSTVVLMTAPSRLQDRDQFAQLVREVASPDVGRMGIEILSFTIKDVYDKVEYLNSLGRAQTANVKRDADIGVAEAERDAGIQVRSMKTSSCFLRLLRPVSARKSFNIHPSRVALHVTHSSTIDPSRYRGLKCVT